METLVKADIFFFISSISVLVVSVGILIGIFYAVRAIKRFEKYAENLEIKMKEKTAEVNDIADDVKNIVSDVKESLVYNFLFSKKKKRKTK
jgi:hypothetical protein